MDLGKEADESVLRETRERAVNAFKTAGLPLFGLSAAWQGPRVLGPAGRWESSEDLGDGTEPTTLRGEKFTLAHGTGDPEGDPREPVIEVVTSTVDFAEQPLFLVLESVEPPILLGPAEMDQLAGTGFPDQPPPGTQMTTFEFDVDGRARRFDAAVRGVAWVARHLFSHYLITVAARNFPPGKVSLVRITDLDPYIEGLERKIDRYRGDRG